MEPVGTVEQASSAKPSPGCYLSLQVASVSEGGGTICQRAFGDLEEEKALTQEISLASSKMTFRCDLSGLFWLPILRT